MDLWDLQPTNKDCISTCQHDIPVGGGWVSTHPTQNEFMAGQPTQTPKATPLRKKGLSKAFIKGNQWKIKALKIRPGKFLEVYIHGREVDEQPFLKIHDNDNDLIIWLHLSTP